MFNNSNRGCNGNGRQLSDYKQVVYVEKKEPGIGQTILVGGLIAILLMFLFFALPALAQGLW